MHGCRSFAHLMFSVATIYGDFFGEESFKDAVVDVPAAGIFIESKDLLACGQSDCSGDRGPFLPTSCRRNVDRPAEIGSRRTRQMKCACYRSWRCHSEADGVHSRGSHVDGITEPLPGAGPTQIEAAASIGSGLQVHTIWTIAVPCTVNGVHIVSCALSANVVVLCLDCAWYRSRHSAEGPFGRRRQGECRVIDVPAAVILTQRKHLLAGG